MRLNIFTEGNEKMLARYAKRIVKDTILDLLVDDIVVRDYREIQDLVEEATYANGYWNGHVDVDYIIRNHPRRRNSVDLIILKKSLVGRELGGMKRYQLDGKGFRSVAVISSLAPNQSCLAGHEIAHAVGVQSHCSGSDERCMMNTGRMRSGFCGNHASTLSKIVGVAPLELLETQEVYHAAAARRTKRAKKKR